MYLSFQKTAFKGNAEDSRPTSPSLSTYICAMNSDTGKWLMLIGTFILLAGAFIYFFHNKMQWLGRLPGDIRIERDNFRFYFPITTMILLSLLVSLVIQIVKRFL